MCLCCDDAGVGAIVWFQRVIKFRVGDEFKRSITIMGNVDEEVAGGDWRRKSDIFRVFDKIGGAVVECEAR